MKSKGRVTKSSLIVSALLFIIISIDGFLYIVNNSGTFCDLCSIYQELFKPFIINFFIVPCTIYMVQTYVQKYSRIYVLTRYKNISIWWQEKTDAILLNVILNVVFFQIIILISNVLVNHKISFQNISEHFLLFVCQISLLILLSVITDFIGLFITNNLLFFTVYIFFLIFEFLRGGFCEMFLLFGSMKEIVTDLVIVWILIMGIILVIKRLLPKKDFKNKYIEGV